MKAISLFLAMVGGAGFFYRDQLQSMTGLTHRQAPTGIYYLRAARTFEVPGGTVRWSAGRELRVAPQTADAGNVLTLTDGRSVARIARTDLIRDMDDAAVLRQIDEADQTNERRLAVQQQTARLDESNRAARENYYNAQRTNRSETVYPAASAPVIYPIYQDYRTVIIQRPASTPPPPVRGMVITSQAQQPPGSAPQPRDTPPTIIGSRN